MPQEADTAQGSGPYSREDMTGDEGEDMGSDDGEYVLEYEAESADECDEGDAYNDETRMCEYVCSSEAECKSLAQEAEQELDAWSDEYSKDTVPVAEKQSSEDELAAQYRVGAGESIVLTQGTDSDKNQEIWEQIAALSPDGFSAQYIESYGVFNDGQSDTLAYVHDDDGNGKWQVVVNVAGYDSSTPRERATTLVHELGHIVTLNTSQVNAGVDEGSCAAPAFFTGEGCASRGSYMADFVAAFWPAADVAAVGGGAGENGDAAANLYERKQGAFVTEYAATNPGEDIAESFALFVLDQRNAAPQTVAEKKVAFFYAYPALTAFRNDMRQALVTGIVRARRASR
jgi:hypothetical protein